MNTLKVVSGILIVVALFILNRLDAKKKKQEKKKYVESEKPLYELSCSMIISKDIVQARHISMSRWGTSVYVLLYNDVIKFTFANEKYLPEIAVKDIEIIFIKRVLGEDLLYIKHKVSPEKKVQYKETYPEFYLSGDKEDLLYIKDLIEERMNRPKIVDLTGGDQTEQ